MIIFDEKKYGEHIIKDKQYLTIKNQGKERRSLVRYLLNEGKSREEILNILLQIPMGKEDYLSEEEKICIYNKIIDKAGDFQFITGVSVKIYKEELDVISSLEDENLQNLMFIYLVYYKWGKQNSWLSFYSKKNDIIMVQDNNVDIWKLAGVFKYRVAERYVMCNKLYNMGLYRIDNFKANNYIYIPFCKDEGTPVIEINNYDNILGEWLIYNKPENYKRCAICSRVIKKTRSPKKYCSFCAREENIRKTVERRRCLKSQQH